MEGTGISQEAQVLAAGAAVAAGGGSCAGSVSLYPERSTRAGPGHGAHDDGDVGAVADHSGAVRPAAGTGLPPALVARPPPHRLGNGDWAGGCHGCGVCPRGTARPDSNRGLCGGAQPAGLDRSTVAGLMGLKATGGRAGCRSMTAASVHASAGFSGLPRCNYGEDVVMATRRGRPCKHRFSEPDHSP